MEIEELKKALRGIGKMRREGLWQPILLVIEDRLREYELQVTTGVGSWEEYQRILGAIEALGWALQVEEIITNKLGIETMEDSNG